MNTKQAEGRLMNPFTTIKDVPGMVVAIRAHLTHNLQGIITQLELDGQRGITSRTSLIEAETDTLAYLADERRISRLADKLVRANIDRTHKVASLVRALDLKSRDRTNKAGRVSESKAARKARQQARSAAAEEAKAPRVRGGKKSKK